MSLLWGSVNGGQPLHGLHATKSLKTSALQKGKKAPSKLASPRDIMQHYTLCTNLHLLQLRSKRK